MTDYRLILILLLQEHSYRQIAMMAGCSQRTVAKASKILDEENLTVVWQVENLTVEDLDRLFSDGRRSVSSEFVPVDLDKVTHARVGKRKTPLKVLWAQYLESSSPPGGCQRQLNLERLGVRWESWTKDGAGSTTHVFDRTETKSDRQIWFDHSYADTLAVLGYPSRTRLRTWWKEYEELGEVTPSKYERKPRYSLDQKRVAVDYFLEHGKSVARTIRVLGYPRTRECLRQWIDELGSSPV